MSHPQGSPHAARRGAAEPPPYGAPAPHDGYEPPDPYGPHGGLGGHGLGSGPGQAGQGGPGAYTGYEAYVPRQSSAPSGTATAPPPPAVLTGVVHPSYEAHPYEGYAPVVASGDEGDPEDTFRSGPFSALDDEADGEPPDEFYGEAPPPGRASARRAGRRKRAARAAPRQGGDPLRRLLPQALVVAFLAGGTSAFVAGDKAVQLSVDGRPRTLHTFADDVEELLADEGMAVGEHDIVAPGRHHDLASGDRVIVRYGRPVTLTLDGERRQVWTTARTVDGALRQLGVRAEGAYLSASRSAPIGRHGLDLDVRTERTLTFMADGRTRTLRTNAATVREALEQAGITLHGEDTTSVDPDSFPRDGQTVSIMRITGGREVREVPVDFTTERHDDPHLAKGTEVVAQRGEKGVERITYALRTVNGVRQKPRRLSSEIVRKPRTQIIRVGTKKMPTTVQGAEGLNWQGLAQCEAGGRPNAVDPSGTYGGLYQFDVGTWQSLGGSGRPQDASAEEQTLRAKKLYVSRGASPWPVCGRKLHG
ncbi:ubiquitin-like domain-containing protein [Streptomyces huiliensis]|uniref:ubiquitin-like domain-containing protein n=1 Tax=Streptomyces huiliensis TaxID=2876027 RepID=UPI0027E1259E|nr:ubiquitin-like domain-containing protein [Streptomyces huiliensis]MBZ4323358.1 ubiquitin-like domain-containing protein [Streptomyces huiliensis]